MWNFYLANLFFLLLIALISHSIIHITQHSLLPFKTFNGIVNIYLLKSANRSFSVWSQLSLNTSSSLIHASGVLKSPNSLNIPDTFMVSHLVLVCSIVTVFCLHKSSSYICLKVYSIIKAHIKGCIFHVAHLVDRNKYLQNK